MPVPEYIATMFEYNFKRKQVLSSWRNCSDNSGRSRENIAPSPGQVTRVWADDTKIERAAAAGVAWSRRTSIVDQHLKVLRQKWRE